VAVIRYLVNDVDVAVKFYTDILGFELVEKWGPPFAMVKRGDLTLWLSGPGSSASRPLPDGSKPAPGGWKIGLEVLEVSRVPASTDVLATYEVTVDNDGDLVSYSRTRRYYRSQAASEDGR